MSKRLVDIPIGPLVEISAIEESDLKTKLMELGIVPGKYISIVFKAPLGDPIAIDCDGFTLSLRLSEAQLIHVNYKSLG